MAVETADDRSFMLADFGVSCTFNDTAITGIFDNDYFDADAGGGVSFATSQPRLTCRTADVSSATEGSAITVDGTNYVIRVVMNDGTGMTVLVLEAQ